MVEYVCQRCNKKFNKRSNYNAHINRKVICLDVNKNNNIINSNNQDDIINEKNIKNNENTFCIQLNTFDYQADTFDYKNDELKLALNTFDYEANTSEHVKSKRIPQIINNDIFMNNEIDNKKIVKKYKCKYCDKEITTNSNLHKHEKICKIKNDKIKKIEEENAELKKKLEENEKLNNKQLVELKPKGQVAKYIVENYKDAPPLRYDGYKLSEEDIRTMMHCGAVKGLCAIIEKIYICGILAKDRSLWCTDMSRVKYYIRMASKNGSKWILEQYGLTVITPCIKDILNQTMAYFLAKYGHQRNKSNEELFNMNQMNILIQELNASDTDKKVMQEIASKCTVDAYYEVDENVINDMKKYNNLIDSGDSEDEEND